MMTTFDPVTSKTYIQAENGNVIRMTNQEPFYSEMVEIPAGKNVLDFEEFDPVTHELVTPELVAKRAKAKANEEFVLAYRNCLETHMCNNYTSCDVIKLMIGNPQYTRVQIETQMKKCYAEDKLTFAQLSELYTALNASTVNF